MRRAAPRRALSMEQLATQFAPAMAAELLVRTLIQEIKALDPSDKGTWQRIISCSLAAGLTREQLASAFSCNLMTVNRWKAGQNTPAPMARKAIKAELIELLNKQAASYGQGKVRPHLEVPAVA